MADELIDALADLFLAASSAVSRTLRSAGYSLTVPAKDVVIVRQPGGWRTDYREVRHNIMTLQIPYWPLLPKSQIARLRERAAEMAAAASATLPFATHTGQASPLTRSVDAVQDEPTDFDRSPVMWVSRAILEPALMWHLTKLPSLDAADQHSAAAFAEDVLRVARDDQLRYRIAVPLSGIEIDRAAGGILAEGRVRIRALSDIEQGQRFKELEPFRGPRWSGNEPSQVELEIDASGPRAGNTWLGHVEAPRLIAALQLHGYSPGGMVASQNPDPPWVLDPRSHSPLLLPSTSTGLGTLTADDLHSVVSTAEILGRYNMTEPRSPHDVALRRFATGAARPDAADAVLDFTIALEALLLPYDAETRRGELSYRFRMHGAHYLADGPAQRREVLKELSHIYNTRGSLVHGGRYPDPTAIAAAHDTARDLAGRGLLRAIYNGFPSVESFNEKILGESGD